MAETKVTELKNLTPQEERDWLADVLLKLSEQARNGEIELDSIEQNRPFERYIANGMCEHFQIGSVTMTMTYHNPEGQRIELNRRARYLAENPTAVKDVEVEIGKL